MLEIINCKPGVVFYNNFDQELDKYGRIHLTEDMLYIVYPNNIVLDVSWGEESSYFKIRVLQNTSPEMWQKPLFQRRCKTILELNQIIQKYTKKIRILLKDSFLGNFFFQPGEISYNNFDSDQLSLLNKENSYLLKNMLRVNYPNNVSLIVEWLKNKELFLVKIINNTSKKRIAHKDCKTLRKLKKILETYTKKIQSMLSNSSS